MSHAEFEILHNLFLHFIVTSLAIYNFLIFVWWWWQQKRATTVYGLTCFLMLGMAIGHSGAVWLYYSKWVVGDWDLDKLVPHSWAFRHYFMVLPMAAYAWYATKKIRIDYGMVKQLHNLIKESSGVDKVKKTLTILIADDNREIRHSMKMMLTRTRFEVIEARDGIEAYELFCKHQDTIDCIILDLIMPELDGWETLNRIRSVSPRIPAIMSSGYIESYFMPKNPKQNFCAFLYKPFSIEKLITTIDRCVEEMK